MPVMSTCVKIDTQRNNIMDEIDISLDVEEIRLIHINSRLAIVM